MPLTIRIDGEGTLGDAPTLADDDEEGNKATRVLVQGPQHQARRCPTCEQVFSGDARFCPFDGDPLVDAPDWNPKADALLGTTIDSRYEIVSVLGEGGMGTIYEVRHTALGRRFALKVLRRDIAQDAELVARFIQEAKAAAAVGHPNIVAVIDFGDISPDKLPGRGHGRVPYFVMEHLTGISLAALLREHTVLGAARAARIFLQCASGLAAAHEAGIVHRDLKPDNVFLTGSQGEEFVKLLDFGVAKIAGAGRLTRAGTVFGTPHYMSPEQAAGHEVDRRADVYALGVIMYECFAGRVPFEADTYMGVLTKHMFAAPDPIERIAPDAAGLGALGPIVMRCLSKDADERFADMGELSSAIEQALVSIEPHALDDDSTPHVGGGHSSAPPAGSAWHRLSSAPLKLRDAVIPDGSRFSLDSLVPEVGPSPVRLLGVALFSFVLVALAGIALWRVGFGSRSEPSAAGPAVEESAAATAPAPGPSQAPVPVEPTSPEGTPPPSGVGLPADSASTPPARSTRPTTTAKPTPSQKSGRPSGELVDPWAK